MPIFIKQDKWIKIARWVLLFCIWLLIVNLLGQSANLATHQALMELGPEKIFGTQYVIYDEAPAYLYPGPWAIFHLHFRILFWRCGICLLVALLATGVAMANKALSCRKTLRMVFQILFWSSMALLFVCLAFICVWEWSLAWLLLLLCVRFLPQWTIPCKLTTMTLIAAMVVLGAQRMSYKDTRRQYDAFWNTVEQCATRTDFEQKFGPPILLCDTISMEDKEWFHNLARFDDSLWMPGKTLAGFTSPQMPDILLLPWFDAEGNRIACVWCAFTPERKDSLTKKEATNEN